MFSGTLPMGTGRTHLYMVYRDVPLKLVIFLKTSPKNWVGF